MAEPERAPLADVAGLEKRFGARVALEGLALRVAPGDVIGLVGANGGGKTTALRILAGLLPPDAGGGRVLGCDLARAPGAIRRRVGYMAQRLSLYADLSVLENLRFRAATYGLRDPRSRARAAIDAHGLGEHAGTRAGALSGGLARRAQLAAALVHEPRLVLLDEPTAGLDALARQDVWRRIDRLAAGGAAVLISTHDLADAERCSRATLLVAGRAVASGTAAEIARAAEAAAIVVRGGDEARRARESLERLPGVLATYPQGDGLRVVVGRELRGAMERVRSIAEGRGWEWAPAEVRLEDAALAFCARAAAAAAAAADAGAEAGGRAGARAGAR